MASVPKRFRASGSGSRERARTISAGQARFQDCAPHKLVQKTGIKTVASSDRIDGFDFLRSDCDAFGPLLSQCSFGPKFDHEQRDQAGEFLYCNLKIFRAGDLAGFALVGKKNINVTQHRQQIIAPAVIRIVIRIQRGGESFRLHAAKELANPWA